MNQPKIRLVFETPVGSVVSLLIGAEAPRSTIHSRRHIDYPTGMALVRTVAMRMYTGMPIVTL